MRRYLKQKQVKNSYVELLSKKIDNLPYSIKPKHFEEFKRNLLGRLMYRMRPSDPPYLETMYQCFKGELEDNNIHVSKEQMLEHTIMFMSLMSGPFLTNDKFEFELRGESITDTYREIYQTPIILSQMEEE
jgi:hypothetical protein